MAWKRGSVLLAMALAGCTGRAKPARVAGQTDSARIASRPAAPPAAPTTAPSTAPPPAPATPGPPASASASEDRQPPTRDACLVDKAIEFREEDWQKCRANLARPDPLPKQVAFQFTKPRPVRSGYDGVLAVELANTSTTEVAVTVSADYPRTVVDPGGHQVTLNSLHAAAGAGPVYELWFASRARLRIKFKWTAAGSYYEPARALFGALPPGRYRVTLHVPGVARDKRMRHVWIIP